MTDGQQDPCFLPPDTNSAPSLLQFATSEMTMDFDRCPLDMEEKFTFITLIDQSVSPKGNDFQFKIT
jgi:hypothetical protein